MGLMLSESNFVPLGAEMTNTNTPRLDAGDPLTVDELSFYVQARNQLAWGNDIALDAIRPAPADACTDVGIDPDALHPQARALMWWAVLTLWAVAATAAITSLI